MLKDRVIWSNKSVDPKRVPVALLFFDHYKDELVIAESGKKEYEGYLLWFDSHHIMLEFRDKTKTCIPLTDISKLWSTKLATKSKLITIEAK